MPSTCCVCLDYYKRADCHVQPKRARAPVYNLEGPMPWLVTMHIRHAFLMVVLAALLSGCGESDDVRPGGAAPTAVVAPVPLMTVSIPPPPPVATPSPSSATRGLSEPETTQPVTTQPVTLEISRATATPELLARPEADTPVANGPALATVVYRDGTFVPKRLEVDPGQQVTFVNESDKPFWPASNIHPTHEIYPEFDALGPIAPGEAWVFTFDAPGFWRYHNHRGPRETGIVVVKGEAVARSGPELPALDPGEITFAELGVVSAEDVAGLFRDDALLRRYVEEYGPASTVALLSENASKVGEDCHQRAHVMGRLAYESFGSLAFSLSGHECHSGGYHGATEAFFRDRGTTSLHSDVATICGGPLNDFFRHQCVHGIGHGLMAWTSYELLDALELCDLLEPTGNRLSCYSGVFMENVVGGLSGSMGHYSEYLSEDPHFPCNVLEDRYVAPCYFYQSSRMVQVFNGDFERVAMACAEAPSLAYKVCFQSMGRDVGGVTRGHPERAIQHCSYAEAGEHRLDCLEGAVQDSFWDAAGVDNALAFCTTLDAADEKGRCYLVIIQRARYIYQTAPELEAFCNRIDEAYRGGCG